MAGLHPSLARMLASVIDARDQKAARAGQVLHDEIGQILSAVGLHLDVLRMDLEEQAPEAAQRISEIQALLEKAFERVRALSYDLNPNRAERAGLTTALHRLVGERRQSSGRKIRLLCDASVRVSGPAVFTTPVFLYCWIILNVSSATAFCACTVEAPMWCVT